MEEMKEEIYRRKSVRKYKMEKLSPELLTEIENYIKTIKPLYEGIDVKWRIVEETRNLLPVKAPYYVLIYSEEKEGFLNNAGFMFQQLNLYLSNKGLGACWLGMAKPRNKEDDKRNFVIAMGFGKALENPFRDLGEFKRKSKDEVCNGTDVRLEAARLAPSSVNSQNWFFDEYHGTINVYQKDLNSLQRIVYGKMNQIDLGIAICHMYIVSQAEGKPFNFVKNSIHRELKGFHYIGTVV